MEYVNRFVSKSYRLCLVLFPAMKHEVSISHIVPEVHTHTIHTTHSHTRHTQTHTHTPFHLKILDIIFKIIIIIIIIISLQALCWWAIIK